MSRLKGRIAFGGVVDLMAEYAPNYEPVEVDKFEQLMRAFGNADSIDQLRLLVVMFTMDMSYPRQDIHVALRKVERSKGWELLGA